MRFTEHNNTESHYNKITFTGDFTCAALADAEGQQSFLTVTVQIVLLTGLK